jgi:hypothetical protein
MKKILAIISLTASSVTFAHTGFHEHVHANTAAELVNSLVAVVVAMEVQSMVLVTAGIVVVLSITAGRKVLALSKTGLS